MVGARIVLSVTKVRVAVRTPVRAVTGAGCPTCAPPTLLPVCAHTLTVTIAPQLPAVVGVAPMANVTAATLPARRTVAAVSGTLRRARRMEDKTASCTTLADRASHRAAIASGALHLEPVCRPVAFRPVYVAVGTSGTALAVLSAQ